MLVTIFTLAANIPASYALSRKKLYGKKLFNMFYLIPMFFTGGLIPTYMVVKNLGLTDTMAAAVTFPSSSKSVCRFLKQSSLLSHCGQQLDSGMATSTH